MSGGGGPAPPDPYETADAQTQYDQDAARRSAQYNQISQVTPFGSTYWTGEIGGPDRAQHTALHPALQSILFGGGGGAPVGKPGGYGYVPPPAPPEVERGPAPNRADFETNRRYGGPGRGMISDFDEAGYNAALEAYNAPRANRASVPAAPAQAAPTGEIGGLFGQIADALGQQIDYGSFVGDPEQLAGERRDLFGNLRSAYGDIGGRYQLSGPDDFGAERQSIADALYQRAENLRRPAYEREQAQIEANLANRGIALGSEAYSDVYNRFDDARNREMADLALGATLAGAQEHQRLADLVSRNRAQEMGEQMGLFGAGGQTYDALSNLRQQQIYEAERARTQPIADLVTLLSGTAPGGLPNMPQFTQTAFQSPDLMGMIGSNYAAQANRHAAQQGGLMGLFGNVAGAAIPLLSDRRLKTDIKRIGTADNGIPLYTFRYGEMSPVHVGAMADEVRKVAPEAVQEVNGFLAVNYGEAF